jgi:hypothetical protein
MTSEHSAGPEDQTEATHDALTVDSTNRKSHDDSADNGDAAVQREALKRFAQGWRVIPLRPGTKIPLHSDWTTRQYEDREAIQQDFPVAEAERNVAQMGLGVVLGQVSGGLVVVDLDVTDPSIAALALPPTGLRDGREGRPNSHWFYRVKGRFTKSTYVGALASKPLIELLGDGQQVVLPPSLHQSGERRVWAEDRSPATVEAEDLRAAARRAAAFQEIALLWSGLASGQRHTAALPLVGGLLRAEVEPETIEALLTLIWPTAEPNEVHNAVQSTVDRRERGEPFSGWPVLHKALGNEATSSLNKILQWLNVSDVDLSDPRPRVYLTSAEEAVLADRTWGALQEANDPPRLFQRAGKIARVNLIKVREKGREGEGEKVVPAIETLTHGALRGELSRLLCWISPGKGKNPQPTKTTPPLTLIRTLHAESSERIKLPVVTSVVSHPIFGPDGSLRTESGYHAGSQTYLWLGEGLDLRVVSETPTGDDVAEARRLILDELLHDFPLADQASKANAVALGLLPFGRNLINSPTPLHFFEAPAQGTGKDLLVKSLGMVWNGSRNVPSMPQTGDEEEWRKAILASMLDGSAFLYIANIKGLFTSRVLEQAITKSETTGRILKSSSMAVGEIGFTWVGTGNNAVLGPDMARRICPTRLDAGTSNPYARTNFRHALPSWALEHRAELVWAFLTLWQNWLAKGRLRGRYTFGSFQDWAEVIGGVLDAAGIPGFLGNTQEFQDQAVDEHPEW